MIRVEELRPGIFLYRNIMEDPANFIDKINSLADSKKIEWAEGSTSGGGYEDPSYVEKSIRDCSVISLPEFNSPSYHGGKDGVYFDIHQELDKFLKPVLEDYSLIYKAHQWNTQYEGWQLMKYGKDNHFVNHFDDSVLYKRTISMSFYLNGDFSGGEIEFPRQGLKIKPGENEALIFPSNYVNSHLVHPVSNGIRYTVVGWWDCL